MFPHFESEVTCTIVHLVLHRPSSTHTQVTHIFTPKVIESCVSQEVFSYQFLHLIVSKGESIFSLACLFSSASQEVILDVQLGLFQVKNVYIKGVLLV